MFNDNISFQRRSCITFPTKPKETLVMYGLPETAASVAVAATLLARRTKSEEAAQAVPTRTCDDCGGSGICPECKGEGFVLKRLSDGSAEKARLNAKNMATRHCRVRTNFFFTHTKSAFFSFFGHEKVKVKVTGPANTLLTCGTQFLPHTRFFFVGRENIVKTHGPTNTLLTSGIEFLLCTQKARFVCLS
ncbi:hypothetical protein Hanom_Chr15g01368021 [Helianthus anomalus]